ncbi:MAG: hypothetical protein NZM29_00140 [Nitrospira sp.]|nr:hypothetical protein [Nitrospira sp.]
MQAPWPTKVQLNLFWMINGYGERALRPVGWFVVIFVMGTFVYWWNEALVPPRHSAFVAGESRPEVKERGIASGEMQRHDVASPSDGQAKSFPRGTGSVGSLDGKENGAGASVAGGGIGLLESAGFSLGTMALLKPDFLVPKTGAQGQCNCTRLLIGFQTLAVPRCLRCSLWRSATNSNDQAPLPALRTVRKAAAVLLAGLAKPSYVAL